jgi:ATP/ADP translocase
MIKIFTEKKFLFLILMQFCLTLSSMFLTDIAKIIIPHENHHILLETSLWKWPFLLIAGLLYFWTTNRYNTQKSFILFLSGFWGLSLVCCLSMIFYEHSHISFETYSLLCQKYPGFTVIIDTYRYWSEILLSVMTQSFYSVFINVFFWQLVIDSTSPSNAKIIYPLFGFVTLLTLLICSFLEPFFLSHPLLMTQGYGLLLIISTILPRKISPLSIKEKLSEKNLSTLESFGHIFTSSEFGLMAGLTSLFFVIMILAQFLGVNSLLLFGFYGFIQIGYLLLPTNIRAKSKMVIDGIFVGFVSFSAGELVKISFRFHALQNLEIKVLITTLVLIFVGVFALLYFKLFKKLKAKNLLTPS